MKNYKNISFWSVEDERWLDRDEAWENRHRIDDGRCAVYTVEPSFMDAFETAIKADDIRAINLLSNNWKISWKKDSFRPCVVVDGVEVGYAK